MLKVSEKLPDKSLFRRLNSIASAKDAVAPDFLYHYLCWASKPLTSEKKSKIIQQYLQILKPFHSLNVTLRKTKIMHWI